MAADAPELAAENAEGNAVAPTEAPGALLQVADASSLPTIAPPDVSEAPTPIEAPVSLAIAVAAEAPAVVPVRAVEEIVVPPVTVDEVTSLPLASPPTPVTEVTPVPVVAAQASLFDVAASLESVGLQLVQTRGDVARPERNDVTPRLGRKPKAPMVIPAEPLQMVETRNN